MGDTIKGKKFFVANGRRYIFTDSLSVSRYEKFEELQVWVGYGMDVQTLFANINEAYDLLNKSKPADAAIKLHNIMNGVYKILANERENPVLMLCSLFIVREDEDVRSYDDAIMKDKINDWRIEGINMDDFFSLAFGLIKKYSGDSESDFRDISEGE